MRQYKTQIFTTLFNCAGTDLVEEFNEIKRPKKVVLFKDDKIVKLTDLSNILHELDTEVVILDNGGHNFSDDYQASIARLWV